MRYFDENVMRLDYVGLSSLPLLFVDCVVESGVGLASPVSGHDVGARCSR